MYNISDSDFKIVENAASEFYSIRLLNGKYKDVIFTYGAVSVKEDKANDTATLSFNWQLNDSAECDPDDLQNNEEFQNYLGALLQFIITDSLQTRNAKIGTANTLMLILCAVIILVAEYLFLSGDQMHGLFVGLWAPTLLGVMIYLKLVDNGSK